MLIQNRGPIVSDVGECPTPSDSYSRSPLSCIYNKSGGQVAISLDCRLSRGSGIRPWTGVLSGDPILHQAGSTATAELTLIKVGAAVLSNDPRRYRDHPPKDSITIQMPSHCRIAYGVVPIALACALST